MREYLLLIIFVSAVDILTSDLLTIPPMLLMLLLLLSGGALSRAPSIMPSVSLPRCWCFHGLPCHTCSTPSLGYYLRCGKQGHISTNCMDVRRKV